jgi:2-succinyl-6-hydroxy-2,4-cyclohexadiene-1-carboxylate synthase
MARLVLVHGFTQTGRSWDPLVPSFNAAGHEVVAPDVPAGLGLWDAASALAGSAGTGVWIGYSMGGRLALHVALAHPEAVERLVLIGATGGIDDPVDRAARVESDNGQAALIERIGVDAFLERWLAQPLFASLPDDAAGLQARRANTPETLASHLRLLGTGAQEPLWDKVHSLDMPVLVVAGQRDAKFTELGRRLVDSIGGNASFASVQNAGHACHLEQPQAFLDVVLPFTR